MYQQLIYSFAYWRASWLFQILAIINKAGINIYVQVFALKHRLKTYVFKSFG